MKNILLSILKILFNKYLIASLIFVFVMFTNEDYNIKTRYINAHKIQKLQAEIERYQAEKTVNQEKLQLLQSDKENLERFAREQFMMKKENEDIFIVVE
ncbi:MAG: septum formation initiator family protein [Paludibacteraceae bacterium]|nr:septum formation initiator family protein [Paludibacteraceae bacterium]MBP6284309.1 septum formation initiator family protein [Paludibacteraceae bacterium]